MRWISYLAWVSISIGIGVLTVGKLKAFLSDMARHWFLSILFVLVVAVFLTPFVGGVYDKLSARLTFLPARRIG